MKFTTNNEKHNANKKNFSSLNVLVKKVLLEIHGVDIPLGLFFAIHFNSTEYAWKTATTKKATVKLDQLTFKL